VLETHRGFISSLNKIKRVIVLGHSLAQVDMPYFEKILAVNDDPMHIQWEVSFHSDANLGRITEFAQELNIDPKHIQKFKLSERLLANSQSYFEFLQLTPNSSFPRK